jgi:hypothetical protein
MKRALLVIVAVFLAATIAAQQSAAPPKTTTVQNPPGSPPKPVTKVSPKKVAPDGTAVPKVNPYATGPFDEALTSLPAFYRGHSLQAVCKDSTPEPKNGSEPIAANQARLPNANTASLYAFVPTRPAQTPDVQHDADAQVLTVTMMEEPSIIAGGRSEPARAVTIQQIDLRETTKTTSERWTLVIQNGSASVHEAKLALSASEASSLRDQLGIVYICRIAGDSPWNSATLRWGDWVTNTELHEWELRYHYLKVDLVGIWLFDIPSGRILKKLAPDQF